MSSMSGSGKRNSWPVRVSHAAARDDDRNQRHPGAQRPADCADHHAGLPRRIFLIGRQKRYDTNNLHLDKPTPLIQRADVFEVTERMAPDGAVVCRIR